MRDSAVMRSACPLVSALVAVAMVAGCADRDVPPADGSRVVAADRPLDSPGLGGDARAARTAALLELALAQVKAPELRRCILDFHGGDAPADDFRPPVHGGWLVVASAVADDSAVFAQRHAAAPEANPKPDDGWQDRVTYRALLRRADSADGSTACLSCVFDVTGERVVYRHAYALDTCQGPMAGDRSLVAVVPLRGSGYSGQLVSRTVSSSPNASP